MNGRTECAQCFYPNISTVSLNLLCQFYLTKRRVQYVFGSSSSASQAGHQAEADSQVRPSEERGPPSHRAVDVSQPV